MLTVDDFEPALGDTFTIAPSESSAAATLRLTDVVRLTATGGRVQARAPFSLLFVSGSADVLPQGLYPMRHPALGDFDLFVVPVGRRDDGVLYEAVFS